MYGTIFLPVLVQVMQKKKWEKNQPPSIHWKLDRKKKKVVIAVK